MKVGNYISELLFEHETVLLPGLGTFFTQYIPAKFIPEKQRVESPSKTIAFNPEVKEGNTPLIDRIASGENMGAEEVKKFLQNFVNEIKTTLSEGRQLKLVKVGVFSQDERGNILFEPDRSINYLEESTGLESVPAPDKIEKEEAAPLASMPPVSPEEPEKAPESESAETPVEESPQLPVTMEAETEQTETEPETAEAEVEEEADEPPPPVSRTMPRALKWVVYTIVPLLVIIIILALNFNYFFGRDRTGPAVKAPAEEITPVHVEQVVEPETPPAEEPAPVFDPAVEPPSPEAGRRVYYLVVGSFREETRAQDLALRLRQQDARLASVFMQTRQGYYRVSYGYYYDLEEAEALLEKVKEEINPDTWILHR